MAAAAELSSKDGRLAASFVSADGEGFFQHFGWQPVRQMRAQRRGQHARHRQPAKAGQRDIADGKRRPAGLAQAGGHERQRAGPGDRHAAGARGAHGLTHRYAEPGEIGNRQRPAADADQRGQQSDRGPGRGMNCAARIVLGARFGRSLEQHLYGDQQRTEADDALKCFARRDIRQQRA